MSLTLEEIKERLLRFYDPDDLLEALQISAEDFDYSNSAEERLDCDYQGDDIKIGFNSRFLIEMLNGLECDEVKLSMSLPNRAGLLTPLDHTEEGEEITMLVMPVMLND